MNNNNTDIRDFKFTRGEVWMADMRDNPTIDNEITKYRPVVIIQNNMGNKYAPTVIIATLSTHIREKLLPTQHLIEKGACELYYDSVVKAEHIRTVSKNRLKNYRGTLSKEHMKAISKCLVASLAIDDDLEVV